MVYKKNGMKYEVSDYVHRAIQFGAMRVVWQGELDDEGKPSPYTYDAVTVQKNPSWDRSWPEYERHYEYVADPENGPRSRKVKVYSRFLPIKMYEFERQERNKLVPTSLAATAPAMDDGGRYGSD